MFTEIFQNCGKFQLFAGGQWIFFPEMSNCLTVGKNWPQQRPGRMTAAKPAKQRLDILAVHDVADAVRVENVLSLRGRVVPDVQPGRSGNGERAIFTRLVLGWLAGWLYRSQILQVNTKYSCESTRRDLHNALLCTALRSQLFASKVVKCFDMFC